MSLMPRQPASLGAADAGDVMAEARKGCGPVGARRWPQLEPRLTQPPCRTAVLPS